MTRRVVWADDPLFLDARVLLRLILQEQRLDESTVDTCRAFTGDRAVLHWRGRVPDAYAAEFGAVMNHVLDAPGAHLQLPPRAWGAAEVRVWEGTVTGDLLVTAFAAAGTVVAATVIVVPPDVEVAEQHDTAVRPAFRGRGLARLVKAAQTLWLHELFPSVLRVQVTVNADNPAMLAVNRALGYRDVRERLLIEA